MRIAEVVVGPRVRRDMGDLDALAASIADVGLLQPIVVKPDGLLVAGQRRLEACKRLGWDDVPVHVVHTASDALKALKAERDENTCRKDFIPSEAVAMAEAIEPLERQAARERQVAGRPSEKFTEGKRNPQALDFTAAAVGLSRPTLQKARAVVEAAQAEPDLLQHMDATGKVDYAYKELKRRQARQANEQLVKQVAPLPQDATFRTIVLDPPWDWGDEGDCDQLGRSRPIYATMPIEQIAALPIPSLAAENAHIYLWITNRSLPKGFALLEGWGFRYVTMLTWVKPCFGMGNYFRGSTEHVLFGVRGSLPLLRTDAGTHFMAARPGEHSAKPDEFFRLVETCSPGPWLEMFSRRARPGWAAWGADAE